MAVFEQGKPVIYSATEVYDSEKEVFSGITFVALPRSSSGPLRYGFTFYHTTSYLSDISDVSITDNGEHTVQEIHAAFRALQLYAQSIPEYQSFRPGEPPRTVIDRSQAVQCGVGLASVLVLPGLFAYLIFGILGLNRQASNNR